MKHRILTSIGAIFWVAACAGQTTPPAAETTATEPAADPFREMFPAWFEPAEPFRVIGDIYYVGTNGLGVYLIPTDEGHILIDGGMPGQGDGILASVSQLGFDPADIRILLNTHAHFDHSGGLAEIKAATGARLIANAGDESALEGGFYLGSEEEHVLDAPPVQVDELIGDGGTVSLGGVTLTAHLTPGHTRGCTSWTLSAEEAAKPYDVLVFCSASVAANRLAPDPQYEGIVADYQRTFGLTRDWKPDVFLPNHPEFSGLWETRAQQVAGDPLAFVQPEKFPEFIARMEAEFETILAKQTAASEAAD